MKKVEVGLIQLNEDTNKQLISWHIADNNFVKDSPLPLLRTLLLYFVPCTVPAPHNNASTSSVILVGRIVFVSTIHHIVFASANILSS